MKIFNLRLLGLISIIVSCAATHAQIADASLTIGDKKLTLQLNTKCPQPRPSHKQLAQYLAQYDPKQEEGLPTYAESRPFTQKVTKEIQDDLVQDGFQYPNGQESVITWMDFDGDGICDFTASAGIGGNKSIDRMFLFRGLPNGKFKLVDTYLGYMAGYIPVVPYIPIYVSREKLPILITAPKRHGILQWKHDSHQLKSCKTQQIRSKLDSTLNRKSTNLSQPTSTLDLLCTHMQEIHRWATNQIPEENKISY